MSRYPNRDHMPMRRPLGYTLGDVTDSSNPSILFGDPTLGTRSVLEQAAGVNTALDPGMSFGTEPQLNLPPLTADQLSPVGVSAATGAIPIFAASGSQSAPAQPDWVKPVLIAGVVLIAWWLLAAKGARG